MPTGANTDNRIDQKGRGGVCSVRLGAELVATPGALRDGRIASAARGEWTPASSLFSSVSLSPQGDARGDRFVGLFSPAPLPGAEALAPAHRPARQRVGARPSARLYGKRPHAPRLIGHRKSSLDQPACRSSGTMPKAGTSVDFQRQVEKEQVLA